MKDIVGYFGCAAISIVMMGVVFQALVWPTLKCRKKSVLGWVVSVVFGFGMLHSMAVKPGGGDALQGPRRSPPQQTAEPTNAVEIVTTTNTPPWETTLAFSHIETTPSNVQLTVAWPMGFYNYDPILDLFIAYSTLTNDWQWTSCQSVPSTATNCSFTVTPDLLGLTELPPALFARVTERTEVCETMDDPDGDGIPDPDELIAGTDPLDALSFLHGVVIEVTNTTAVAGSQVYVSWERVGDCPVSGFLTNSAARSFFTTFTIPHTNGEIRISCFRDLNGNATFDPDYDIALTQSVPDRSEYTRLKFTFGDVDHDGINDLQERHDGTGPYSASSLRITRTVSLKNADIFPAVTNYVSQGLTKDWNANEQFHRMIGTTETQTINTNATNGSVYLKCFRDFNRNGIYDEDFEPLYVYAIQNETSSSKGTVNVEFKDKDGDTIPDSIEWREGTNINDRRSYCYNATLTVTGIFSTTNRLYAQPFFGTNALAAAHLVDTNQEVYVLEHSSTTNSERFVVKYWDDLNANLLLDDGEPFTTATVHPNDHETVLTYDLPYSKFDANNNRLPDWWEFATGLSTNSAPYDYYTDTDHDGLINLHEYWTGCDPLTPDGSNTVLSILARSIDDRLTDDSTGRMEVYNNYYSSSLEPNTNCWAYGIDLSCASPYNIPCGRFQAGTLISEQHIVLAAHYQYGVGTQVHFKDTTGATVVRSVIAFDTVYGTDIFLCLLDEPVPPTCHPAKLLPHNFIDYIGNGLGLPTLSLDQDEHAIVADLYNLPKQKGYASCTQPKNSKRINFYQSVIDHDSGNPRFLVNNDEVFILCTFHYGGGGSGPFLTNYATEIQSKMDSLSAGKNKDRRLLSFEDFTMYPQIVREVK